MRIFFEIYTGTLFYRARFIKPDAKRIDLDGNEIEFIKPKEQLQAKRENRKITWALDNEFELKWAVNNKKRNTSNLFNKAEEINKTDVTKKKPHLEQKESGMITLSKPIITIKKKKILHKSF